MAFFVVMIFSCLSCEKDDAELYTGYVSNTSSFTLTIRVFDYETGDEQTKYYKLSPNFHSKTELEERKYYFKAYQNDGSFYSQILLDINAVRNDATTSFGEVCDWFVEFN